MKRDDHGNPIPQGSLNVLEHAREAVRARVADFLGLPGLAETWDQCEDVGRVATVSRSLDALYRLEGGLTVSQWCILRTLIFQLLDQADDNTSGDGLPQGIPLYRIDPQRDRKGGGH